MVVGAAGLVAAEHIAPVVGLRLLTGIGEALFLVGGISVVNDLAPEHRRGEAVSLYTIASYSGLAIGPVLGELTLGDDRWDAVWLLSAACGATAGLLGFRSRETRPAVPPSEGASWLPHRVGLLPGAVATCWTACSATPSRHSLATQSPTVGASSRSAAAMTPHRRLCDACA
jgi:MFS family permease